MLVQPCACDGSSAHLHLSCLHTWQLRRMDIGQDPSRCELCREPYQVADTAWSALEAAGGVGGYERRWVEQWRPNDAGLAEPLAAIDALQQAHEELHSLLSRPDAWPQLARQRPLRLRVLRHIERVLQAVGVCEQMMRPLPLPRVLGQLSQLRTSLILLRSRVLRTHWAAQTLASLRCAASASLFVYLISQWCWRARRVLAASAGAGSPAGLLRRLLPDAGASAAIAGALLLVESHRRGSWQAVRQHSPLLGKVKRMGLAACALGASLALHSWGPAPLAPLAAALADVCSCVAAVTVAQYPSLCLALAKPVVWCGAAAWRLAAHISPPASICGP